MTKLVNRAKMTTATTGTGSPITLGSAVDGYQTFADAGVVNSDVVRYVIEDGVNWEIGSGTYSAGTLTRTVSESSNADAAINLSGSAVVFVTASAADIVQPSDLATVATTGAYSDLSGLPTLYSDASVDTHLNTGTASSGEVLSWTGSDYDWVAVSGGATNINGLSDGWTNSTSVGLGANALTQSGTSANNTAVGYNSQRYAFTGVGNTSIGVDSLNGPDFSNYSTAAGYRSLYWNNGDYNIGIGAEALYGSMVSFLNGTHNIGIGYQTGYDLDTGSNNFLGGYCAGTNLTTGSNNVAIGKGALDAATTGGRNIAIGQDAMGSGVATDANGDNIALGYQAAFGLTTGTDNIAIGELALTGLSGAVTGVGNVALGKNAGRRITNGAGNLAIGGNALAEVTSGEFNVGVGAGAGQNITGSSGNVAIGYNSAQGDRSFTTAIGYRALSAFNTGAGNTVIGYTAGDFISSGTNNTVIGRDAASAGSNDLTTGSNNTIIGYNAAASSATVSNEITLGNSSITTLRCQVTTITSLSDARDKTDIQPLNAGLDFVNALEPVSFTWNMRDGGKVGEADTGFIAQDLKRVQEETGVTIPHLVFDANPEKLEAGYGKLIPVLVQAIKDLSAKVDELEARLEGK